MLVRIEEGGVPLEVLRLDVFRRERQFKTVGLHIGNVTELVDFTTNTLGDQRTNQIVVVALVP